MADIKPCIYSDLWQPARPGRLNETTWDSLSNQTIWDNQNTPQTIWDFVQLSEWQEDCQR